MIETGDAVPTIETGDAVPTIETGDAVPTIESGFADFAVPVIETGDAVPTIETGFAVPTIETGDAVPVIETGFAVPTIETGDAVPMIETPPANAICAGVSATKLNATLAPHITVLVRVIPNFILLIPFIEIPFFSTNSIFKWVKSIASRSRVVSATGSTNK